MVEGIESNKKTENSVKVLNCKKRLLSPRSHEEREVFKIKRQREQTLQRLFLPLKQMFSIFFSTVHLELATDKRR